MNRFPLRRLTALLLLLASLAVPAFADAGQEEWSPVNANKDWAEPNIKEANMLGLLPELLKAADMRESISRKEMCYLAATAYEKLTGNEPLPLNTDYFTDTSDSIICAAREIGIVDGYPDESFKPEKLLTRQEFFQILANFNRALNKPAKITQDYLKDFKDREDLDGWAEEATQEVVGLGVVQGNNKRLLPLDNTSRQEAIVMFFRNYKEGSRYLKTEWLTAEQLAEMNKIAMEQAESSTAGKLVKDALGFAEAHAGYIFGATGPNNFDCSGFTWYLFRKYDHPINRTAQQQMLNGKAINTQGADGKPTFENLRPGDLVFFAGTYASKDYITHVGIYIGNNQMVHAANTTRGVTVDSLYTSYYYTRFAGARRILED